MFHPPILFMGLFVSQHNIDEDVTVHISPTQSFAIVETHQKQSTGDTKSTTSRQVHNILHDTAPAPPYTRMNRLFLVLLRRTLGLLRTSEFLASVLSLFTLLSAGLLDLGSMSYSDQSVSWFELLHGLDRVVDEGETSSLATTILCSQTENVDLVGVGLVDLGEFGS